MGESLRQPWGVPDLQNHIQSTRLGGSQTNCPQRPSKMKDSSAASALRQLEHYLSDVMYVRSLEHLYDRLHEEKDTVLEAVEML